MGAMTQLHGGAVSSSSKEAMGRNFLDTKLLQVGALVFLWIIGAYATIRLMVDYAAALKPLVLAAMSVSILEWVVQTVEFLQWKAWVFCALFLQKLGIFIAILALYLRRVGLRCLRKADPWFQRRLSQMVHQMKDWNRLRLRWDPSFAGRNTLFRFVAAIWALSCVAAVALGLTSLLYANVENFAHGDRMELYRQQFFKLVADADASLQHIPDTLSFLPNTTKDQIRRAIVDAENTFRMNSTFIAKNQEYIVDELKDAVGSSSTLLVEVTFYVLYTMIWLFAPLKINPNLKKEQYAGRVFNICGSWKRSVLMLLRGTPMEPPEEEKLHPEGTSMRDFYQAHSDPRQDLQERLYRIMQVYFSLKLLTNVVFAVCVWCLLHWLAVDLSYLLAVACLCLSFIPELGTIISVLLPIPIILLMPMSSPDCTRSGLLGRFLLGMLVIKLLVSNVLESYLMGHNPTLSGAVKDQELETIQETHPVAILFVVVLAGEIWGPTGMLLAVPCVSFMRLALNFWRLQGPELRQDVSSETGKPFGQP